MRPLTTLLFLGFSAASVRAQENFNFAVQVSGSELVPQGVTMVERHSNFTRVDIIGPSSGYCPRITPSTKPSRSRTASTTGSSADTTSSLPSRPTGRRGTGCTWDRTSVHASPYPRSTACRRPQPFARDRYQRPTVLRDTWTWELRPIVDKKIDNRSRRLLSHRPPLIKAIAKSSRLFDYSSSVFACLCGESLLLASVRALTHAGNTSGFSSHTSIHCAISCFSPAEGGIMGGR